MLLTAIHICYFYWSQC